MRCTISQIYLGKELYMFWTSAVHHQGVSTLYTQQ